MSAAAKTRMIVDELPARVEAQQGRWELQDGAGAHTTFESGSLAYRGPCLSPDATRLCAMAKRVATDAEFSAANDALQVFGGYGYLAEYGVEKIVRALRVHQILEGTNEIMRVIVTRGPLHG